MFHVPDFIDDLSKRSILKDSLFETSLVFSERVSFFKSPSERVSFSERVKSSWHIVYVSYRDDFYHISLVYQKP